jgi:transcriptional regulator with XRE-family HTH domain
MRPCLAASRSALIDRNGRTWACLIECIRVQETLVGIGSREGKGQNGDNGDIKELAKRVGTTQQQISRLESTSYECHSLSMLRRVAEALGATIHIELLRGKQKKSMGVAQHNSH